MKNIKRVIAGVLSLILGSGAIYLATAFYRTGRDLVPLTGGLRGQDYAMFLTLGCMGVAFLTMAYVYLIRSPRA